MNVSNIELTVATSGSAGHELKTLTRVVVPARGCVAVDTGVTLSLQPGTCAQICGKSGHAFRGDVIAFQGLIDSDYQGTIGVKLFNLSDRDYVIEAGKSVAQLLIQKYSLLDNAAVETETERSGGFGSTNQ